jgi:hypothetical protein
MANDEANKAASVDIVEALRDDYQRFPADQSYHLYAENVYFKDPLNEFRGVQRYRDMIGFIERWFINTQMDLHNIQQQDNVVKTEWTLHFTAPTPWQPRISIPGWSELTLSDNGLVISHVDYWHCSRFDVVRQVFQP